MYINTHIEENIWNSHEVIDDMDILKWKKWHLRDLCIEEASKMVGMAKGISMEEANKLVNDTLNSGNAYNKFLEFIKAQGGDINGIKISDKTIDVKSNKVGTLTNIKALNLGMLSVTLGAGRVSKEDTIDHSVGIVLKKHIGDHINIGDVLCTLYVNKDIEVDPNNYFEII